MEIENTAELRLLVECARGGSLTAASKVMNITPAAASAMLKKLEARLGARLVERSTRALRLTAAGERLRDYAQRALELLDEGLAQLHEGEPTQGKAAMPVLRGRIRVSASSDLTRRVVLPLLDAFLERHPGVELHLNVGDGLQDVVRDEVDVALRYGELADSRLVARRLFDGRRLLVGSPDYLKRYGRPQHPQDLASGHECIRFKIGDRLERQWKFWRKDQLGGPAVEVAVQGRRTADDGGIAHLWALEGRGLTYKSELDVRESLASGALVEVLPEWVGRPMPLHALMPSQRFMPQRIKALVDHLAAGLAKQGGRGG
ncbi:LysR family transcriptional regulator [Roseateles terrae]|uniref:DNA-binding transcriptional LysR family regulator n=1 Tax=Roseateles terrae TaxID=431060 RepID=A0ABR6GYB7_9BURK|nr:LysR family transcriptional regulator [Roseateles terrae]MBB3197108.1 DNA-binding transcriptional LysR family regulator [Roseateles terrae]OWQ84265.1 LysR family transcriptional regulator [Roseateles terrae]